MAVELALHHYGADRRESAEAKALRIVREELRCLKWSQADLNRERDGHEKKTAIAKPLREETMMMLTGIAKHTGIGSEANVRKQSSRRGAQEK